MLVVLPSFVITGPADGLFQPTGNEGAGFWHALQPLLSAFISHAIDASTHENPVMILVKAQLIHFCQAHLVCPGRLPTPLHCHHDSEIPVTLVMTHMSCKVWAGTLSISFRLSPNETSLVVESR